MRELWPGSRRKTDVIHAAAAAGVAALHGDVTTVIAEDHTTVFTRQRMSPTSRPSTTSPGGRSVGALREVGGDAAAPDPTRITGGMNPQGTRPGSRARAPRRRCELGRHRAANDYGARPERHTTPRSTASVLSPRPDSLAGPASHHGSRRHMPSSPTPASHRSRSLAATALDTVSRVAATDGSTLRSISLRSLKSGCPTALARPLRQENR